MRKFSRKREMHPQNDKYEEEQDADFSKFDWPELFVFGDQALLQVPGLAEFRADVRKKVGKYEDPG